MDFMDLTVSASHVLILNTNGEARVGTIYEGHIYLHLQREIRFEIYFLHLIDKKGTFY